MFLPIHPHHLLQLLHPPKLASKFFSFLLLIIIILFFLILLTTPTIGVVGLDCGFSSFLLELTFSDFLGSQPSTQNTPAPTLHQSTVTAVRQAPQRPVWPVITVVFRQIRSRSRKL